MRVNGSAQNLINGVSRQPAEIRLVTQLEESVNQFPTVSRGLVPRNPAILKGVIDLPKPKNSTTHLIERDDSENYVVTISPEGVEVHDLEGNKKQVNAPQGFKYLKDASDGDLEALTVADHTFILNKKRIVTHAPDKSTIEEKSGLIHIVQGDYNTTFNISVNGNIAATYTTDGGPFDNTAQTRCAERGAKPSVIATRMAFNTKSATGAWYPAGNVSNLRDNLNADEWFVATYDNVIYLKNNYNNDFTLNVDAGSETKMRAHKSMTSDFSKLPLKAPNGFRLKISGSKDTEYDDYYVIFDKPTTSAEGRWKETIAPSVEYKLASETMPHILVREADGTFTFKPATWSNREVGNLDTNPWPSFVGYTINGMVFFKNRIGFISGESCAMSRTNDFFNFFIESILTPLDTDPVDISISYPEISNINYAVPFSGEMIMFTTSVPFRMASGDTFTPKSANFEHLLSNSVSSKVSPITAGSKLFFINDVESGSFVHEFTYDRDVGIKDAPCISDHVNGYIPSDIRIMVGVEDLNILALVSEKDPNTMYIYKWLWIGNEKGQSAWQKWSIKNPIIGLKFYGEELVIVTDCGETQEVLSINCHEAWKDADTTIYLDRRVEVYGTYDYQTDKTTYKLPYKSEGCSVVVAEGSKFGFQPVNTTYVDNLVLVDGEQTAKAYVGFIYDSFGTLSPLLHRSTNNQGAYGNAIAGIKTVITNVTLETGKSVFMDVDLERDYRKPYTYNLSAAQTGTKTGRVGTLIVGDIDKPVSVLSPSSDFKVTFKNRGPYEYSVLGYRWSGSAIQKAY